MRNFLVSFTQEGRFFVARCPSLGVTSQGETLDEARANIQEAIELYIESFGLDDVPDAIRYFSGLHTRLT